MRVVLAVASVFVQAGAQLMNIPVRSMYLNHSIISTDSKTLATYADNSELLMKIFTIFPLLYIEWNHNFAQGLVNVWIQAAWYNRRMLPNSQDRRVEFRIIVGRESLSNFPMKEIQRTNDIFSKTITSVLFELSGFGPISDYKNAYDSVLRLNISIGAIYIRYDLKHWKYACNFTDYSYLTLDHVYVALGNENELEKCFRIAKTLTSLTIHLYKEVYAFFDFDKADIKSRVFDPMKLFPIPTFYKMRIRRESKADTCGLTKDLKQKHIAKPRLAPEVFGFSVYFDEFDSSQNPIVELLAVSPRIMLENKKKFNVTTNLEIDPLLLTIGHELIKREHIMSVNIAIKLNFVDELQFVDNSVRHEVYVNITQQVWDASKAVNQIYPGLVHGIFLQIYNDRTFDESAVLGVDPATTVTANDDFSRVLSSLRPNPTEAQLPKLGLSYRLNSWSYIACRSSGELPGSPSIVLLEYSYRFLFNCFNKEGFYQETTNTLKDCTQKVNKAKSGTKVGVSYYFDMLCNLTTDDTALKFLDHQRKLIETLTRDSETRKTSVYVNNAFKNQEYRSYGKYEVYGLCGWWNFSAPEKPNGAYRIEDRVDVANRALGFTPQKYTKIIKSETHKISMWWIILPVALVLAALGLFCVLVLRYRSKHQLKSREIERFFNGDPNNQDKQEGTRMALCSKYDKEKYEIPDSAYSIDNTKCLGSGEFGIVYTGIIKTTSGETVVAVKTTKYIDKLESVSVGCTTALRSLMGEVKVLAYMGQHQNVVSLIGANTAKLNEGNLLVFLELCENGSLLRHLRSLDLSHSDTGLDLALAKQFLTWANEIADGMDYLAEKKIVHADLASRNILLDANNVAKISDFGLSRRLYEYSQYVKTCQEPLPWRWMAPESLKRLEFSEKSDVWAYGVTLWEIYSLADTPYAGLSWTPNFVSLLEAGLKLAIPKYNDNNMFTVMSKCWCCHPFERPKFSDIKNILPSRSTLENDANNEYNEIVPVNP